MKQREERYEVVVCGGGLAGFSAALSAARLGRKTCIIQDRPVFGGNSSSEVRVTVHGAAAFHHYARETGIISEALIEERARNHEEIFENGWTNSVFDLTLYDMAVREELLTPYLNTSVHGVEMSPGGTAIRSVRAQMANAETELIVYADYFIDATGDGVVADRAGCEWRWGSESASEFGETHAPEVGRREDTMGSSIHFKTKDTGRDVPFEPPEWIVKHDNPDYFYKQGRKPKDVRGGFWWIEIGVPYDTIHDHEEIRHELTRHTLGVWDWMKNKDPNTKEAARTHALDWIGQVPGKRESRRVLGHYFMTENDIQAQTPFEDEIGFGGWFLDLHTPGGLLAEHSEANSKENYNPYSERVISSYVGPYPIPLRILLSRDVDNLLLAGRDVSMSHASLGSARVMGTCALMGQAAGTAAAVALETQTEMADLAERQAGRIKQRLLRDGCFLLNTKNEDPYDLARSGRVSASSQERVSGCSPGSPAYHDGLDIWWDQWNPAITERLDSLRGQLIGVGADRVKAVSVLLSNSSGESQDVPISLKPVGHVWDYRTNPGPALASGTLRVPPGERRWARWECNVELSREQLLGGFVRLDLGANPNVQWHIAAPVKPGHVSMFELGNGRMRTYEQGVTMSYRIEPAQACFAPEAVINGWSRPYTAPNLWRSDPALPGDQWVELAWETAQRIARVELTFPGHLLREYHAYGPLYADPQCPRDYSIAVPARGADETPDSSVLELPNSQKGGAETEPWELLLTVTGNYQRQRKHELPDAIDTERLRIIVHRTNGDPAVGIHELRCYGV
jgi:hypothetical protein